MDDKFEFTKDETEMFRFACHIASEHFNNLYEKYNRDNMKEEASRYRELYYKLGDMIYG